MTIDETSGPVSYTIKDELCIIHHCVSVSYALDLLFESATMARARCVRDRLAEVCRWRRGRVVYGRARR